MIGAFERVERIASRAADYQEQGDKKSGAFHVGYRSQPAFIVE
ncbi:hypothetical protein GbCGDNIH2_1871 [Granulibacter bethesdensis]|uniref:Uncharacterized protein n=1 Tax=Granulibacter bethesdensis (strain ATCC BAA-1260 / CGDNIH1) TaxID=391165 RepID=Q0BQY3_GRABC|nr:hypothetical protein GbCGDNIH1_1871 [Granulibacter bethesdensis CGDNIH1]APG30743.1 hypothetical protein GbCGDNIH2_1871 [Granulibacter bethesdensis]APH52632.1 hypothetical protein GbCGDNIH5_1871 [Granulibacter bethesdensis]APH65321.1 hypothetical protein GbCGDNIH1I4_1871 [Granulibacter bethesdensis]